MTCNLWRTERWPDRQPALERLLDRFNPDVFCVQELHATTQAFLERALPRHHRVHDPLPGWTTESNLYWSSAIFEEMDHGAEDVGHTESDRRLFWVRLRLGALRRSVFVATAHLTSPRYNDEPASGASPRVRQLNRIGEALQKLVRDGEPAFFMGDMNDAWHPHNVLKRVGFVNCFAALGLQSPPTFQCYPTANTEPGEHSITEAIDILTANRHARPIAAAVPHCYARDVAPSDHWPVHAIYQLEQETSADGG
jgi:endonuclease/exonuclease/phosphatase family metal-dependent hydrolase